MTQIALLAIDQGTTSSRTMAFSPQGDIITSAQEEFPQIYPQNGWVEHAPDAIWNTTLATLRSVYKHVKDLGFGIAGIGITNQRETSVVWDRTTGTPIYNAIVWQDRRTADTCQTLKHQFSEANLTQRTGLLFDPYFSASKVAWILDHVDGARPRAQRGELAFGTIDSYLIYKLTKGQSHVTDATNASRTNLFNIHTQDWDSDLLDLFNVPRAILPTVLDSAAHFGNTHIDVLGESLPILGVAGDQQAAAIGQACFAPGDIKSTYGTGAFVIMNTGTTALTSHNRLLSTICYRLKGIPTYALEGSIFMAGAAIQWLRDELKIIHHAADTEDILHHTPHSDGVYVVPAFAGLGAPYWDPHARGAILGMTRGTNHNHITRATMESIGYQTHDLLTAMAADGTQPASLKVDGGMVTNDGFLQFLSDILDLTVERPKVMETTALGAAYLVGLQAGIYTDLDDIKANWTLDKRVTPDMDNGMRKEQLRGWARAVKQVMTT